LLNYFILKNKIVKQDFVLKPVFDFHHFNLRVKSLPINNQFKTPTITKGTQIQNNLNEIKL